MCCIHLETATTQPLMPYHNSEQNDSYMIAIMHRAMNRQPCRNMTLKRRCMYIGLFNPLSATVGISDMTRCHFGLL